MRAGRLAWPRNVGVQRIRIRRVLGETPAARDKISGTTEFANGAQRGHDGITTLDPSGPLTSRLPPPPTWISEGFIAPGRITLFSSPAKSGKTTPLSHVIIAFS
jgi:hypothetical protein